MARGTEISNETAKVLKEVAESSSEVRSSFDKIETSFAEQAAAIDQIKSGLSQISSVVQTNAATAEENSATSEEMSSQAVVLRAEVGKFKLASTKADKSDKAAKELLLDDTILYDIPLLEKPSSKAVSYDTPNIETSEDTVALEPKLPELSEISDETLDLPEIPEIPVAPESTKVKIKTAAQVSDFGKY